MTLKLFILFIVILLLYYLYTKFKKNIESFTINEQVPKNIFQIWHSYTLPEYMEKASQNVKENNPDFNYYLFNKNDCYEFIKNNFDNEVSYTYQNLIPYAYKADLWRYCVLYKYGGIYLDMKFTCINNFNFNKLLDNNYYCKDFDFSGGGVFNGIMISKPGNKILERAIYQIVDNYKNNYYGKTSLEPTGPLLLKYYFTQYEINNFKLKCYKDNLNINYITFNDIPILKVYENYANERSNDSLLPHYTILWKEKKIYNVKL